MIEYIGNDVFNVDGEKIDSLQLFEDHLKTNNKFLLKIQELAIHEERRWWNWGYNEGLIKRLYSLAIILNEFQTIKITHTRFMIETSSCASFTVIYENGVNIRLSFTTRTENIESAVIEFEEKDKIELKDISLPELIRIIR